MEPEKNFVQVIVNGQVESAQVTRHTSAPRQGYVVMFVVCCGLQFAGLDKLVCKYQWSYGRDWSVKMVRSLR
jgi:hypothetical protein